MLDTCFWGFCSLDFMTAMTTSAHVCDVFRGQFNGVSLILFSFSAFRKIEVTICFSSVHLFPSFLPFLSLSTHCSGWGVFFFFSLETVSRQVPVFQAHLFLLFCPPPPSPHPIGLDLDFRLRMTQEYLLYVSLSFFVLSLSSRSGFLFFFSFLFL